MLWYNAENENNEKLRRENENIKLGLLGLGTVGSSLKMVQQNADKISMLLQVNS